MLNENTRIELNDTVQSALYKMSEGNPGALTAMLKLMSTVEKTDPDNMLGRLGVLLDFDSHGIYGSHIWLLYKDVCGQNELNVHTLMRAMQLGLVSHTLAKRSIAAHGLVDNHNFASLLDKVRERLPAFAA